MVWRLAISLGALPLLLSSALLWRDAYSAGNAALARREYKAAESYFERALGCAPSGEIATLYCQMARAAYRDQEKERAFTHYLCALDSAERLPSPPRTEEEEEYYCDALELHLSYSSQEILDRYGAIVELHPTYYHLKMVVALAYANLDMFEEFFDRFLPAYQRCYETFLAYKTRAILHLRLMDLSPIPGERETMQRAALSFLKEAIYRYPGDGTLHRLVLYLAGVLGDEETAVEGLQEMLASGVLIPRSDLLFYVHESLSLGQFSMAQRIIERGREQYEYSRSLKLAEETLDKRLTGK